MRKNPVFFLLLLLLCSLMAGCLPSIPATEMDPPAEHTLSDYTNMEIYQYLRSAVTDDSSLEEIIDSFAEMCTIPVDTASEMYLYEVYSYEFEGAQYLNCHIVRQVDEPNTDEYIQLHLDIVFQLDDDIADFRETTWYDKDPEGFIDHIRTGIIYQTLTEKTIYERYVSIDSTW